MTFSLYIMEILKNVIYTQNRKARVMSKIKAEKKTKNGHPKYLQITDISECDKHQMRSIIKRPTGTQMGFFYLLFGLVSLFNGISIFLVYLMPKPFS